MAVEHLDDLEDPRITQYRDLHRSNLTRQSGLFIVEGHLLVERLLASDCAVESVLVDARRRERIPAGVPAGVPVYVAGPGLVERIVGFNFHRGILACGRRRAAPDLTETLGAATGPQTVVVCVDVQDPTNLGGICRNCAALGADAIILNGRCADPYSRRVLRVSMGAVFRLPLITSADLLGDLVRLREELGFELAAAVVDDGAEFLDQARRTPRLALLFGNEGYGLPEDVLRLCQRRITIPMLRGTDSLNAAVATGVFLYHFTRVAPRSEP